MNYCLSTCNEFWGAWIASNVLSATIFAECRTAVESPALGRSGACAGDWLAPQDWYHRTGSELPHKPQPYMSHCDTTFLGWHRAHHEEDVVQTCNTWLPTPRRSALTSLADLRSRKLVQPPQQCPYFEALKPLVKSNRRDIFRSLIFHRHLAQILKSL